MRLVPRKTLQHIGKLKKHATGKSNAEKPRCGPRQGKMWLKYGRGVSLGGETDAVAGPGGNDGASPSPRGNGDINPTGRAR